MTVTVQRNRLKTVETLLQPPSLLLMLLLCSSFLFLCWCHSVSCYFSSLHLQRAHPQNPSLLEARSLHKQFRAETNVVLCWYKSCFCPTWPVKHQCYQVWPREGALTTTERGPECSFGHEATAAMEMCKSVLGGFWDTHIWKCEYKCGSEGLQRKCVALTRRYNLRQSKLLSENSELVL